jgi:hypothetical protein
LCIQESESDSDDDDLELYLMSCEQIDNTYAVVGMILGMLQYDTYVNKADYRKHVESGFEWVMTSLGNRTSCFNMFRMHNDVFHKLHNVLCGDI